MEKSDMNRVVCWTIELEWADGTKETLADLPIPGSPLKK